MVTDIEEETLKRKGLMKLSKLLIIKFKNLKEEIFDKIAN